MTANSTSARQTIVFTVGHSNRSAEEFREMLITASVSAVYDVRRYPSSKYNPHFNGKELRRSLETAGIRYAHVPEFGGFRETSDKTGSHNHGWQQAFFRNYADYALSAQFQTAFQTVCNRLEPNAVVMCAERDWRSCHRQILADYLLLRGFDVVHLVDATKREQARFTPFSQIVGEHLIHYPREPEAQIGFDF